MESTNFKDIFKNSFLDNFNNSIPISTIIITLGVAFLLSIFVFYFYKLTTKNVIYSKRFNISMAMMSIVTAAIILSMQANIVVSLGMVGALSIVRFRTAIKESRDLLFLFWSIANGIIIGASMFSIAFVLAVIFIMALLFFDLLPENKLPYILVLNLKDLDAEEAVIKYLKTNKIKYFLKSKNVMSDKVDLIYEITVLKNKDIVKDISKIKGVIELNLISQDGEE